MTPLGRVCLQSDGQPWAIGWFSAWQKKDVNKQITAILCGMELKQVLHFFNSRKEERGKNNKNAMEWLSDEILTYEFHWQQERKVVSGRRAPKKRFCGVISRKNTVFYFKKWKIYLMFPVYSSCFLTNKYIYLARLVSFSNMCSRMLIAEVNVVMEGKGHRP